MIVATREENRPRVQIVLVFSDDTYYEFYSDSDIGMAGSVDEGDSDKVHEYLDQWPDTEITFF